MDSSAVRLSLFLQVNQVLCLDINIPLLLLQDYTLCPPPPHLPTPTPGTPPPRVLPCTGCYRFNTPGTPPHPFLCLHACGLLHTLPSIPHFSHGFPPISSLHMSPPPTTYPGISSILELLWETDNSLFSWISVGLDGMFFLLILWVWWLDAITWKVLQTSIQFTMHSWKVEPFYIFWNITYAIVFLIWGPLYVGTNLFHYHVEPVAVDGTFHRYGLPPPDGDCRF